MSLEPTNPVAMTGSENLETQRTMTVPTAMLWAASSIHHSPLPHNEKLLSPREIAGICNIILELINSREAIKQIYLRQIS